MEKKCGTVMVDIKQKERWVKKCKSIKLDDDFDDDDLKEYLDEVGYKSLKLIKKKLASLKEQSQSICSKETEERDTNINKINEYKRINNEIEKCVTIENSLM
eukprot:837503_1